MLSGATDLNSVLTNGVEQTRRLFRGLANRFNGDVFDTLANQLQRIRRSDLRDMAAVLRGDDLPTGQGSLWPYDFSVLPADLVSSVYEQLLEDTRKSDAAYYTPRFLVDLTLDEVLAWQGELPEIVDLACGSGAFMTEAFRRLAYRVRVSKGKSQLSYSELRDLLVRHIYGVDSNLSAARIAIFGLYLALLEEIDPPTVWASVVLPKLLNANVVVSDAFAEHPLRRRRFDVVVSNPPWSSKLTEDAALFLKEHNAPVSDRQSAQAFLWLATDMLRPGGTFGLVMPAKPLLHNRSYTAHEFRSALFRDVRVRSIVDLSAMRREIFAAATAPSAVIVAETPTSDEEDSQSFDILHIAAHPRAQGRAIDALVVTPEEVRTVDSRQAIARPDVWRTMLWGGPRDLELLDRLRGRFPSLDEVTRQQQWASGQGYQVGGGDANSAEDLHGLPIVETKFVHPLRILAPSGFEEFRRDYLHRPRDPALYEGPHVLVRRTLVGGRLAATLLDEDAVFPNGVIGFAGPSRDRTLLMTLAAAIVSSLGHYWHFMTSASWGVERDFVEVNEHAALPLAEPTSSQAKALARVVSRAQGGLDEGLREELDELIFSIYGLSDSERERVRRQAVQAIGRFRRPAQYDREISDRDLSQYVRILRNTLRDTLGTLNVEAQRFKAGRYRAVSVTLADFTEEQSAPRRAAISSDDIAEIVRSRVVRGAGTTGVVAQPAGFFVDEDTIYIVKTADADRWSVDASLDDAGRIFSALAFGA